MKEHHFEEHDEDPGEDASVIGNDRQIVEAEINVGKQCCGEDEHDRYGQFVVRVIQALREDRRAGVEIP